MALIRIVAPHFVAGIHASRGKVDYAAPILDYMRGWTGAQVRDYCLKKGWKWERVEPLDIGGMTTQIFSPPDQA